MFDNEKEEWDINETLKVQYEASGDEYFNTPIRHLKIKKRENNNLTVGKVEQLTSNTIGDLNTPKQISYIDYINMLEKENSQLKQRIRELEEKLEFEELMDDDLK